MDNIEFVQVIQSFQDLANVQLDECFREDWSFTEITQWASLEILKNEINFVILDNGVFVLDDVLMLEAFEDIDLFFDASDVLLADGDLFHGHQNAIVEVETLVDLAICPFSYFFNQLVVFNYFVFRQTTHSIINIMISFRNTVRSSFHSNKLAPSPEHFQEAHILFNID